LKLNLFDNVKDSLYKPNTWSSQILRGYLINVIEKGF